MAVKSRDRQADSGSLQSTQDSSYAASGVCTNIAQGGEQSLAWCRQAARRVRRVRCSSARAAQSDRHKRKSP